MSPGALGSRKRKRPDPRAHKGQEQYENTFRLDLDGYGQTTPERQVKESEDVALEPPRALTAEEQLLHDLSRLANQQQTQRTAQDRSNGQNAPHPDGSDLTSDQLAFAASAANEMVSPAPGVNEETGNDQNTFIDPQLRSDLKTKRMTLEEFERKGLIFHHVQPGANPQAKQAPYMQDFHVETDKPRSKFSDERSRAMQDMRKTGACIRCRMLKKPCSGDLPCLTCGNIETARRWRQPCTRARISDEFDLLRENVHMLLATNQMDFVDSLSCPSEKTSGVIEATHFPGEAVPPATFSSVHGRLTSSFPQEALNPFAGSLRETQPTDYEGLEQDYGNVAENLALYLENAEQLYCERETSVLMRETLLMAKERLEHKPDSVLREAVSLWVTIYVLVDSKAVWQIQSVRQPDGAQLESLEGLIGSMDLTPERDALSHRLITGQLLEFAEKRATNLCKSVMHEFEKRMVHRQRVHQLQFETFLTAVILLSCLEKLAWLYETWAVRESADKRMTTNDDQVDRNESVPPPSMARGVWPAKRPPDDFVDRADFVADIIAMLCRLRELPPPMKLDVEGYLIADLDMVPRRTSRYDASGYKGITKKPQPKKSQARRANDVPLTEEGHSNDSAKEKDLSYVDTRELDQQGQFDDHHAALVAQLHQDLQASSGAEPHTSMGVSAAERGQATAQKAAEHAPQQATDRPNNIAFNHEDAVMTGTSDGGDVVTRGNEEPQEARTEETNDKRPTSGQEIEQATNQSDVAGPPDDPPHNKPDEEDEAIAEDPFMAHLRQAQAAARAAGDSSYPDQPYPDQEDLEPESEPEQDDGQPRAPRPVETWFKRVRLKVADLFNARDHPPWDEKDCHCWELKYISRMLLPDTAAPR